MGQGIFQAMGAYHASAPAAGLVAASQPASAMSGLGQLSQAITDNLKKSVTPSMPTGAGLGWTLASAGGGYVVGAYMGHPIVGAVMGGLLPFPLSIFGLALMGAFANDRSM